MKTTTMTMAAPTGMAWHLQKQEGMETTATPTANHPPHPLSDLSPSNHKQKKQQQQQSGNDKHALKRESSSTTIKTEVDVAAGTADPKSKWLDYLNSFQESNYDTD